MVTGRVVRFDEFRGYGFVAPDTGGEDVFMHVNDLAVDKRQISTGATVEFIIEDGERGLKASRVRLVKPAPGHPAAPFAAPMSMEARAAERSDDGDEVCDVLSTPGYAHEVTEALLAAAPSMTGEQILQARQRLVKLAQTHGWVEV